MWATILEKAWSKVKGSVSMAGNGGMIHNGLRSLVGAPFFEYIPGDSDNADDVFGLIKSSDEANYLMGAGTNGDEDSDFNDCGIAMDHAYSLITAFELVYC